MMPLSQRINVLLNLGGNGVMLNAYPWKVWDGGVDFRHHVGLAGFKFDADHGTTGRLMGLRALCYNGNIPS